MRFKITDYQRRGVRHTYFIRGEGRWGLTDLVPHMLQVSKHSKNYALEYSVQGERGFALVDKRDRENRRATLSLEGTIDPKVNRVHVFDSGVGAQMIRKYLEAVEKSVEEK